MQDPLRRDLERLGQVFKVGPPPERRMELPGPTPDAIHVGANVRIPRLSATGRIVGVEWRAGTLLVKVNVNGIEIATAGHNVIAA